MMRCEISDVLAGAFDGLASKYRASPCYSTATHKIEGWPDHLAATLGLSRPPVFVCEDHALSLEAAGVSSKPIAPGDV